MQEYKEIKSQIKDMHRDEYVPDEFRKTTANVRVESDVVAAYLDLAHRCDGIYHPPNDQGMSADRRIRCEFVTIKPCKVEYLLVTIRGTKTLEDLLWDTDIYGISPGDDLRNNEDTLLVDLVSTFADNELDGGELIKRLTKLLTWRNPEDNSSGTLQVSHGVWTLAKRALVHISEFKKENTGIDFSKLKVLLAGHGLRGGAAFLATLVLSCTRPDPKRIVCVTFGQPRVLLTPQAAGAVLSLKDWQTKKRIIMAHMSTALSQGQIDYHRIVTDTDPIALIPTRIPRLADTAGEKFVHVPEAIVIKYDADGAHISRKSSTSSVRTAHRDALSILRGMSIFFLQRSHKMTSYIRILDQLMGNNTSSKDRYETSSAYNLKTFSTLFNTEAGTNAFVIHIH